VAAIHKRKTFKVTTTRNLELEMCNFEFVPFV
jgi:hypothetical protein